MIETTLTGKTPDIGEENIKKLMTMFPEVVTEGKVDFEKLKQLLGEYVDDSNERYNFTWNGKGRALRLSQTPSLGTLRPSRMGKGKGNPEFWVAVVKPGRILFELSGVSEEIAKEAFELASHKLPVKTKFVKRQESFV